MNKRGDRHGKSIWPPVLAVTATYAYFLLFAEFAFLKMVEAALQDTAVLPWVMGSLGLGGVAGSVAAIRRFSYEKLALRLSLSFGACVIAAGVALCVQTHAGFAGAAAAIGFALGWNTVTLAAGLQALVPAAKMGRAVGLGTGLAYALCNVPFIFTAPAHAQAWLCLALAGVAALAVPRLRLVTPANEMVPRRGSSVAGWVVLFVALVWLDSGAFYIVQHTASLREVTWSGGVHLWTNALVHLGVALAAGWLLDRGGLARVMGLAWVGLALACVTLDYAPGLPGLGFLYAGGVSLYSTAFVFFAARDGRPWVACVLFVVAGWLGSALGIGMVRDLHHVPWLFVASTGLVFAGVLWRKRAGFLVVAVVAVWPVAQSAYASELTPLEARGRQVYIAEGCVHCHSQYIRPEVKADVEWWGPARTVEALLREQPPLPGNRRQGPDLSNVGNRRSTTWNRWHLIAPREVAPGSRMPSYRHLFAGNDVEGEALLAYLSSLGAGTVEARQAAIQAWQPQPVEEAITPARTRTLFAKNCVQCHGQEGAGDGPLMRAHGQPLPDWKTEKWRHVSGRDEVEIARLIKFGLPGTLMAGHETWSDAEMLALARHVKTLHVSP